MVPCETQNNTTTPIQKQDELGCLLFSIDSPNSGTTFHGWNGEGKAFYFPLLKSVKRQKALNARSVSTNFVADCSFFFLTFVVIFRRLTLRI